MEIKVIYKEIAEMINKTESNMKYMSKNNPSQLELLKLGALCKKYGLNENDIKQCIKLKNNIK